MDPTTPEAIKAHMETILQNSMKDAMAGLKKRPVDQREAIEMSWKPYNNN